MRKIIIFLLFLAMLSTTYSLTVQSKEVAFREQALDIEIRIEPNQIDKIFISTPHSTRLIKWTLPYEKVVYEYESRGASDVHTWTFTERTQKALILTAKVQFNQPGDHNVYIAPEGSGDKTIIEKRFWVSEQTLCGNRKCDENEEYTCPKDCPKFELPSLPKLPSWVLPLSIVIIIVILVLVFIKLKYWY